MAEPRDHPPEPREQPPESPPKREEKAEPGRARRRGRSFDHLRAAQALRAGSRRGKDDPPAR